MTQYYCGSLSESSEQSDIHAQAVKTLLVWHVEATNSQKAKQLLVNWDDEKKNFSYIIPRALLQYQDSEAILAAKPRKELLEELATALAAHQVNKLKRAWRSGQPRLFMVSCQTRNLAMMVTRNMNY